MTLLAWLLLGAQLSTPPIPANAPLTISISALSAEVSYGAQIPYSITLTNHTDHEIDYFGLWGGPTKSRIFEITDMSGKNVLPRPIKVWSGSERQCILNPGETTGWEGTLIPSDYIGLVPGKYHVRISAPNPDNPRGERLYSNTITVDIQPPSPN